MKYVVGTMKWNKNVETGNVMVMEVATESNETMLLLILLNYWNVWTNKAAAKDKTMVLLHNGDPVYTKKGKSRDLWSDEGLRRCNELKEEVKKDQATREGEVFDRKVQEDFWKNSAGRRGRKM
jgi:hypothetical protein